MCMTRGLFAIVCTLAASGIARADERVWADASGKYNVTGTFVRERDGEVHIRCADGRLVAIDASMLSKTDTDFIRNGGRESSTGASRPEAGRSSAGTPVVPTADRQPAADSAGGGSATDGTKEVVAEGVGISREEALKDAFRAAIRQVVGEVVDNDVQVSNDRLIKDEILVYSDGFIPHHEVIASTFEGGIHRVTIRATVERRRLVAKLRAAKITVKTLDEDGESVVVRVGTDREAREAAKAMVAKAFVGFPSDQLEARVIDWKPSDDDGDHITLAVRVEIAPSADAYQAFQERLCQRLQDLAKLDGEFSTTMELQRPMYADPCQLPNMGSPNFLSSIEELMPDVDQAVDRTGQKTRWPMVFAVAELVSKDHTRINWRYFVLDGVTGDTVMAAMRQRITCKLTFLDDAGKPTAVDRFDPCQDRFLRSSAGGNTDGDPIPWSQYLLKCWYLNPGENKPMCDCLTGLTYSGNIPAIAFIAPVIFADAHFDQSGMPYVPRVALTRYVRLTEDEVRPIKKVRCEMTFRKGVDNGSGR